MAATGDINELVKKEVLTNLTGLNTRLNNTNKRLIDILPHLQAAAKEFQNVSAGAAALDSLIKKTKPLFDDVNDANKEHSNIQDEMNKAAEQATKKNADQVKSLEDLKKAKLALNELNQESSEGQDIKQIEDVALGYEELRKRMERVTELDLAAYMEEVLKGTIDTTTAAQTLSSRMGAISSLQQEFAKSLNDGNITMEQYQKGVSELSQMYDEAASASATLREGVSKMSGEIEKKAAEAFANLSDEIQKQSITLIELQSQQAKTKTTLKDLEDAYKSGTMSEEEYRTQKARLLYLEKETQEEMKNTRKEMELSRKVADTSIGSYDNLSAQYSLLKLQINKMGEAEGDNVKVKREMEAQAEKIYAQMNKLQKATGKNQLQVGNYNIAVSDLNKTLSFLSPSLGAATTGVQSLGKQLLLLLANPIVATIAAIVGVITALVAVFSKSIDVAKGNEEQFNKLQQVMSPMRVIAAYLTRAFENLATVFLNVASAVSAAIVKFSDWIGITDDMAGKVEEFSEVERRRLQLTIRIRKANEENAKIEGDIAELRAKAVEKDKYTNKERIQFLDEAAAKESELLQNKLEIAKENLSILERERDMSGTSPSTDLLNRISEATIAATNAQTEYNNRTRTINSQRSEAMRSMARETQQNLRKELDYRREIQEATLQAMNDSTEKERALLELSYQRRIDTAKLRGVNEVELIKQIELEKSKALEDFDYNARVRISEANLENRLAYVKEGSQEELLLTMEMLSLRETEEIRAAEKIGADIVLIQQKYDKLRLDSVNSTMHAMNGLRMKEFESYAISQDLAMSNELSELASQYEKGIMSRETYERKKRDIAFKYSDDILQEELRIAEYTASMLTGEDRLDAERRIAALRLQVQQQTNDKIISDTERSVEKRKQLMTEIADTFLSFSDVVFKNQSKRLEDEAKQNDEWRDRELSRIQEQNKAGLLSDEQAAANKADIEARSAAQREIIERKQAEQRKKQALAQIAMDTATAIVKNTVQLGFLGAIPVNILQTALGAAQSAIVMATRYAKGTDDHPGGDAIVGDGGRSEMIITPDGKMYKSPSVPTFIADMPQHTVVLPDFNKAMADIAANTSAPALPDVYINQSPIIIKENGDMIRLTRQMIAGINRLSQQAPARVDIASRQIGSRRVGRR